MSNSLSGPSNFADDGSAVIARQIEVHHSQLATEAQNKIAACSDIYEIDRTVNVIKERGYKRIALQFPDELLLDSGLVAQLIREQTGSGVYILADTSYGSCCVDEVAAQHISADAIIHYGRSCQSPTSRLPVIYVFGKQPVDVQECAKVFDGFFEKDKSRKVILMYDVIYSHSIDNDKRKRFGRTYNLPDGDNIEDYTLFYVGDESPTLSNIMMTHSKCDVYSFNPEKNEGRLESAQVNRALMRRYFLVQKAKDADVIGIAVGTLGVESKGKKAYTFVMGKLNVAKMANFMEIDCFVYVACPENSLIDSKEFYRPIVTPYELEIALSKSREWTGEYVTDFQQLLPDDDKIGVDKIKISQAQLDAASDREDEDELLEGSDEDQAPHFSLVTGKLKQSKRYTTNKEDSKELSALLEGTKDLTVRDKNMNVAKLMSSAAGEYLQSREFRGLEVQLGETPVELATEGRAGIARGYNSESGFSEREREKY
ncbi:Diphthamide biosynthesis protein 2 [Entomortierella beljakovae]|nr:Diphthamide biosynthesis protein 2 [Entomortierella beljakovae]